MHRLVLLSFILGSLSLAATPPLQEFKNATFVQTDYNDGDSFRLRLERGGVAEEHVARLYFVDAFESIAGTDTDKRRLLEQTRYFGFPEEKRKEGRKFGVKAAARVAELLARPFTVHTAFASAPGRSRKPRIYVMITTAQGDDLAAVLVRAGLARVIGTARKRPDGTSADAYQQELRTLELEAAVKRRGAWSLANFDRIVELRNQQREEDRALEKAVGETVEPAPTPPAKRGRKKP